MTSGEKVELAVFPVASSSFLSDATFSHPGGEALLQFEFERDGITHRGGIRFERDRAFRWRAESHCTVWHVDGVHDTLAEVADSNWVAELRAAQPADMRHLFEIHHFMIYIDSTGCFEVAAASWSWLREELIP